jgi:3-methylfumaryl-CoA hydratase
MMNTDIPTAEMTKTDLAIWGGKIQTLTGGVSAQMGAMIHATVGSPQAAAPVSGDPIPHLWHWCAFVPTARMSDLGPDGHPRLGGFLPPVPLERRMWAGGQLTFHCAVHVDEPLTRRSTIRSVVEKAGRAGPMVFVTVDHEISGVNGLAISEQQDIVYLPIPDSYAPPRKIDVPRNPVLDQIVQMSTPLLFRYSAITFNAHRIHYDLPYATGVEQYPGLVVHGPLQATLLMDAATRHRGKPPVHFRFRGVHPMFHDDTLRLMATDEGPDALALCTASSGGHQGMQATAFWEEITND